MSANWLTLPPPPPPPLRHWQYRHDKLGMESNCYFYIHLVTATIPPTWWGHNYRCCCIKSVKLGHRFHALLKVCSDRDDIVPLKLVCIQMIMYWVSWEVILSDMLLFSRKHEHKFKSENGSLNFQENMNRISDVNNRVHFHFHISNEYKMH